MEKHLAFWCCFVINVAIVQSSFAQQPGSLKLYQTIKTIVQDSMQMQVSSRFFSIWKDQNEPLIAPYFCKKDTIAPCNMPDSLRKKGAAFFEPYEKTGKYETCDFILYKTFGTTATYLTKHLLAYTKESQAFIAFHEVVHQHFQQQPQSKQRFPYPAEEGLCDAFAAVCTQKYAALLGLDTTKVCEEIAINEQIYTEINRAVAAIITTKDTLLIQKTHRIFAAKLHAALTNATSFQFDRFNYPVNNAYFLRYRDYACHYFAAKNLLTTQKTPQTAVFLLYKTWAEDETLFWELLRSRIQPSNAILANS
jgi:hypothetical protein